MNKLYIEHMFRGIAPDCAEEQRIKFLEWIYDNLGQRGEEGRKGGNDG